MNHVHILSLDDVFPLDGVGSLSEALPLDDGLSVNDWVFPDNSLSLEEVEEATQVQQSPIFQFTKLLSPCVIQNLDQSIISCG